MSDDDHRDFEDVLRGIAQDVTESLERLAEEVDVDALVRSAGLDPERGREWFDQASRWLQDQARAAQAAATSAADAGTSSTHPDPVPDADTTPAGRTWSPTEPHPLDTPTAAQGAALAALDSGRWTLEPGTSALTVSGDGPGPSDALGLVRGLRVRDWLRADGSVTVAGQHALERWLATTD